MYLFDNFLIAQDYKTQVLRYNLRMEHNMILSASGWRKVFAADGNEESRSCDIGNENKLLCALIAESFAEYMIERLGRTPVIAVGRDTRPTGEMIADIVVRVLSASGITVKYIDVTAAPEIFCYAKTLDGFLYISASHNPVGHNGIKFGMNDGGVLDGCENSKVIKTFCKKCAENHAERRAQDLIDGADNSSVTEIYSSAAKNKQDALKEYFSFMKIIIAGTEDKKAQENVFAEIKKDLSCRKLGIAADMNGSSRTQSLDKEFIKSFGIDFLSFNDKAGEIVHAIIPEGENLEFCAQRLKEEQLKKRFQFTLGYMPDCDGDRGNIVYWNERTNSAECIPAQEVFALCVLSELAFSCRQNAGAEIKRAVAVNCPTSMRINEICSAFGAELFRAEVGEANVVNLARKKRSEGYEVRILGEGSNGGNITYPSGVRDPIATIFALVKLLTMRDSGDKKGLFHLWCEKSKQEDKYKDDFTLSDVLQTLPEYCTTIVNEERAKLNVKSADKGALKEKFKTVFEDEWEDFLARSGKKYGICGYEADTTNGTEELLNAQNWNNANGGLKIRFFDKDKMPIAFIWMRPSGTENVFRILCDVKGSDFGMEKELLAWETEMLRRADSQ